MSPLEYVNALSSMTFEDAFNPYSSRCSICDLDDAPYRRRNTLLAMLQAAQTVEIDSIWIGRDLGYRGGRRTGLAFTDDLHLPAHVGRWGLSTERPTSGAPMGERTAAVIWSVLALIRVPIFLWNVFPLHPHKSGEPLTNRSHNSHERRVGEDFLAELILLLRPQRLAAIGNDAAHTATRFADSCEVVHVRHPSYGGQTKFVRQIRSAYDLAYPQEEQRIR